MSTTTKIETLTLTDTRVPEDQQEPRECRVEMPADYDPSIVTWEDVMYDGMLRIVPDPEDERDETEAEAWLDASDWTDGSELWREGRLLVEELNDSPAEHERVRLRGDILAERDAWIFPDGSGVIMAGDLWDSFDREGRCGFGRVER